MTDLGDIACSLYSGASRRAIALAISLTLVGACATPAPIVQRPPKPAPATPSEEEGEVVLLNSGDTSKDKLPDYRYAFLIPNAKGDREIAKLGILSNKPPVVDGPYQLLSRSSEADGSSLYILRSDNGNVYSFRTDKTGNPTTSLKHHVAEADGQYTIGTYRLDARVSSEPAVSSASPVSPMSQPVPAASHPTPAPHQAAPTAATAASPAAENGHAPAGRSNSVWKSPWLWGAVGALAAGVGAYLLSRGDDESSAQPMSPLQPYDVSPNNGGPGDR